MQTIQIVLSDAGFAEKLQQCLTDNGSWPVDIRQAPAFGKGGIVVLDDMVLTGLASAPDYPDRVVLIATHRPGVEERAWDMGIRSVVHSGDSIGTILLAIMSAYLRLPKSAEMPRQRVTSPTAASNIVQIPPVAAGPEIRSSSVAQSKRSSK